jgi:hypothetical protein
MRRRQAASSEAGDGRVDGGLERAPACRRSPDARLVLRALVAAVDARLAATRDAAASRAASIAEVSGGRLSASASCRRAC